MNIIAELPRPKAAEVAEGMLISPLFYLSVFVSVASLLTAIGFWTDTNYDIPKLFQLQIIFPLTVLNIILNGVYYWKRIEEHNRHLKRILVLFIAYATCMLQFMPLGLDMLQFIFDTAAKNSHLMIDNEAQAKAFQERSIKVLVTTIIVFPVLQYLTDWTVDNRARLASRLIRIMSRWFVY